MIEAPPMEERTLPTLPASGKPCTACGLCESVCAAHAIRMQETPQGFLRPVVDTDICIRCHACEKACAGLAENLGAGPAEEMEAYEAWTLDAEVRAASSSGGVFTELARHVLAQGGIVFGVEMEGADKARFIGVEQEADLAKLRGSKYLQADPALCYREALGHLRKGRQVLFSGTPCQVRAMRARCGKKYANLLLVDVACYGVPSRLLLRSMLREQELSGGPVERYIFRDKRLAWRSSQSRVVFKDGSEKLLPYENNLFLKGYLTGCVLNESCYTCNLPLADRSGDLSLGDFWGRRTRGDEADRLGVSCIVCHTPAGRQAMQAISGRLHLEPITLPDVERENHGTVAAHRTAPACREAFLQELAQKPLGAVLHRFLWRGTALRPYTMLGGRPIFLPRLIHRFREKWLGLMGKFRRH